MRVARHPLRALCAAPLHVALLDRILTVQTVHRSKRVPVHSEAKRLSLKRMRLNMCMDVCMTVSAWISSAVHAHDLGTSMSLMKTQYRMQIREKIG